MNIKKLLLLILKECLIKATLDLTINFILKTTNGLLVALNSRIQDEGNKEKKTTRKNNYKK